MTHTQFIAIAKLIRLRKGPAKEAAQLVLVVGFQQADTARWLGCSPQSVSKTIKRVRLALALARVAVK